MIEFRPAVAEDFAFLLMLHQAGLKEYVSQIWPWDDAEEEKRLRDQFEPTKLQVILLEGRDVGILQVEEGNEIFLARILIAPAYQNRCLGSLVIRQVIAERAMPVTLSVLRTNPAKFLYERLGFQTYSQDDVRSWMRLNPRNAQ